MNVPANANVRMTAKLRKKLSCLSWYPLLRMMGGRSTLRRMVGLNAIMSRTTWPGAMRTMAPTHMPECRLRVVSVLVFVLEQPARAALRWSWARAVEGNATYR